MSDRNKHSAEGKDRIDLLHELKSGQCPCGNRKRPRETFCSSCYFALPRVMRQELYNRVGEGYEEAYKQASDYLRQMV